MGKLLGLHSTVRPKPGVVGSFWALVAHIATDTPASMGTQLLHPEKTRPWCCGSLAFSS